MKRSLAFSIVLHVMVLGLGFSCASPQKSTAEGKTNISFTPEKSASPEASPVCTPKSILKGDKGHIVPKNSSQAQNKCIHSFGGIGVVMGFDPNTNTVYVNKVIQGYPAEAAGILPGDIILSDFAKIKGEPGTNVVITLQRDGSVFQKIVTRGVICTEDVGE